MLRENRITAGGLPGYGSSLKLDPSVLPENQTTAGGLPGYCSSPKYLVTGQRSE